MVESDFHAFFRALKRGDFVALRDLIKEGRDVNARNQFGWTPLMWARGNTVCIAILLGAGADVNAVNQFGTTALACEAQKGHAAAVILLLRAGARVDVRPFGGSLLAYVMTGEGRNHPRLLEVLRNAGATE
jgi:ankyrin repeat protein